MSDIKEMLDNIIDARRKYQVNNRAYFWHRKYEMACMYDAHISTCKSLEAERDYAACETPPNYPLPVIRLSVEIGPEGVFIDAYDDDGYETVYDYYKDHPSTCRCEVCRFWS